MTIITTELVEYCKGKFTPKIVVYIEEYSPLPPSSGGGISDFP
jgi:hypothetical protein